ncbi:MAG: endolytic transglycosylase MltG [Chlorobiaceae bacterium]
MASKKTSPRRFFITGAAILLSALACMLFLPGINTASRKTSLIIHRGTGFKSIVDDLHRNGSIKSTWPVLLTGSIIPRLHNIKPGRYSIPSGMSIFSLLYYLHTHKQDEVRITIPEGLDLRHVARLLARNLDMDSTAVMAAASDSRLLVKYNISAPNAEGYLFPGTYDFVWASTPEEAAGFLIGRFRHFYTDSIQSTAASAGLTETALLTLASIVEAETPVDQEKPLVASVYLNRLKHNMRLQADPTVQYALGGVARRLFYKDLETDSPYNTYRHNGLPPGPICNPGTASILAVLNPSDTKFIYFVATGKGGHNFAESLAEHNQNIKKYRIALRDTLRLQK